MHSVRFTAETSSNGVVERDFTVGEVPGVLWSPASGSDRAPLVLMGHGGGEDKRAPAMAGRAHRLVCGGGFTVATIDAPGHGGRPRTATDEREIAALRRAMATGEPVGPIVVRYNADIAQRAVPEWRATLDAVQELPEIGTDAPVGYYGLNMGTAIGVPLTAAEPRITPRGLRSVLARVPGRGCQADHHTDRVRAPVGRRAHRTPNRSGVVRRLRLDRKDAARQRGQAHRPAQVRDRQRGPVLRPAPRPDRHITGLT
jgi:hypothetical protein